MTISSITMSFAGEVNVQPRLVRIICDNTADEIMATNFLQPLQRTGYQFQPTDFIQMQFGDQFGVFQPVITPAGTITLTPMNNQTNESPSAWVNNIAYYMNEAAVLGDSGININSIPIFTGSSVAGNLPTFYNTTGGVSDSGVALTALQTKASIKANVATNAGGSASFSITATGVTTTSIVAVNFKTQANAESIFTASPGTNVINIVASGDPGACTLNWIEIAAAQ